MYWNFSISITHNTHNAPISTTNNSQCYHHTLKLHFPDCFGAMEQVTWFLIEHGCDQSSGTPAYNAWAFTQSLLGIVSPLVFEFPKPYCIGLFWFGPLFRYFVSGFSALPMWITECVWHVPGFRILSLSTIYCLNRSLNLFMPDHKVYLTFWILPPVL